MFGLVSVLTALPMNALPVEEELLKLAPVAESAARSSLLTGADSSAARAALRSDSTLFGIGSGSLSPKAAHASGQDPLPGFTKALSLEDTEAEQLLPCQSSEELRIKQQQRKAAKEIKKAQKESRIQKFKQGPTDAEKTRLFEENAKAKAIVEAAKRALKTPDPRPNGLPVLTTFADGTVQPVKYWQSFNLKHFHPDRSGLGGGNTNTVIRDASQVAFGTPVESTLGTGSNMHHVVELSSTNPIDMDVYKLGRSTSGRNTVWNLDSQKTDTLTVSGIQEGDGSVVITHFAGDSSP